MYWHNNHKMSYWCSMHRPLDLGLRREPKRNFWRKQILYSFPTDGDTDRIVTGLSDRWLWHEVYIGSRK